MELQSCRLFVVCALVGFFVFGKVVPRTDAAAGAQTASFEVASIRPSGSREATLVLPVQTMPGGRLIATAATLEQLIRFAYVMHDWQRVVGNSQLLQQRFDVNAVATGAVPTRRFVTGPLNHAMQQLLAERFRLRVRWESEEQPVLVLVRARADGKLGPGLRPSALDCAELRAQNTLRPEDAKKCQLSRIDGRLRAAGHHISEVAVFFSTLLQRPVIDATSLNGPYEIDMTSSSEGIPRFPGLPPRQTPINPDDRRPSFETALREQLGLRLESRRERIPALFIEQLENLVEN